MASDRSTVDAPCRRILVLGPPGSGKSTLARRLGEVLGYPVVHLDAEFWEPGWETPTREAWIDRQETLMDRTERWILDGNYDDTLEVRLRAADTALLLDVSRYVSVYRILRRRIEYAGRTRPDMAAGCPEKVDREFLWYAWTFQTAILPIIETKLADHDDVAVVRLDSPAEVEAFLEVLSRA